MTSGRRVLLVATTVDAHDVGESRIGHEWAARLAERHQVTLLTYHQHGHEPASRQLPGVRVVEWPEPPLVHRLGRMNSMLKPAYVPFYVRARRWVRAALARGERFDIGHQCVPVALRYPSPLVGTGIPYVLGPVGGGLRTPAAFVEDETAPWYVGLRAVDELRLAREPLLRRTFEQAECVVGIAPYVRDVLSSLTLRRFEVLSDTGIDELPPAFVRPVGGPVRLLFVGRLVRTKGARDAIRAMAELRDLPVRLDVVGEGYDGPACRELVDQLSLGDRVTMHGRVPRERVAEFYRAADVFVFPSYREAGGTVVHEAMSHGLPLVVCDRGGPASAVDDSCGVRVGVRDPDQLAHDVAVAVRRLAGDPSLRARMGEAARERVTATALWSSKVHSMEQLYDSVLDRPRVVEERAGA